jgi:hypothetical protein
VSTPEKDDFQLDMTFTGQENRLVKPIAIAVAAVGVVLILATMTTDFAAHVLPMSDEYLQVLVPQAKDGKEPLALKTLDQTTTDNTLTVTGSVLNRTDFPVSGLVAVLEGQDVNYGKQRTEVPLDPAEIPSQGTASFEASITFAAQPSAYAVTFRVADGPAVPHMDDRAATYGFGQTTPAPEPPKQ